MEGQTEGQTDERAERWTDPIIIIVVVVVVVIIIIIIIIIRDRPFQPRMGVQQDSRVLYTFTPNKSFASLINISLSTPL